MSFERILEFAERQRNAKKDFLDNNYYQASLIPGDFEIESVFRCADGKAVLKVTTTEAMTWGEED